MQSANLVLLTLCFVLVQSNVSSGAKIITETFLDASNGDPADEETSAMLLEATSPDGPSDFNATSSDSASTILQPVASESASEPGDSVAPSVDSETPIVLEMASESISHDLHSDKLNAKESSKWNVHKPLPKQTAESKNKYTDDTGCHEEQAILLECKRRLNNRGKMKKDASSPASDSPASPASRDPAAPASAIRIADAAASLTMFGRNSSQDCFQCGSPCSKFCCYAGQSCCLYKTQCSCCY